MSKYVMSDIHGCYDMFIEMLEKINFKDEDELYILGDIIDRGDKPIDILNYIINHKNITLLKGNHEVLMCSYLLDGDLTLWMLNGGSTTYSQILANQDVNYIDKVCDYFKRCPTIVVVDKFILVHGGVYFPENYNELSIDEFIKHQDEENCLWQRSHIGNEKQFKDYTIICGHTPVQVIEDNQKDIKIVHKLGHKYIDCGCYYELNGGKLSCLRLDDLAEYYV